MLNSKHNWNCRRVKPLLPGLPDGELAPEVRQAVAAHLEACEDCRVEAGSFRMLSRTLQTAAPPAEELPSGTEAVAWILRQEATRSRPWWETLGVLLRPGAAVGLVVAAVLVIAAVRLELGTTPRPRSVTSTAAPEVLPALIVVDDEETGRQVLLGPNTSSAGDAGTSATP